MSISKIPLTIGVTGHLNPRAEDLGILRDAVRQELAKILNRCPHTPVILLCSLAGGADLLCAETAEEPSVEETAGVTEEKSTQETTEKKSITPMEHYNMSDFLKGKASKIVTAIADEDKTGFILKNGKPLAVLISNDRYERLLKAGIDINEY